MGLQFRRRTKGKDSWLNFSKSGVSASVKLDKNYTVNLGKRGMRSTINLGEGFRYTINHSKKKKSHTPIEYGGQDGNFLGFILGEIMVLVLFIIGVIGIWYGVKATIWLFSALFG